MPKSPGTKPGLAHEADAPAWWHGEWGGRRADDAGHRSMGAEAGEAAWHHNAAFEDLRTRVEFMSGRILKARSLLGADQAGALDGVADALDGLKDGIAKVRAAWEADDPWLPQPAAPPATPAAAIHLLGARPEPDAKPDPINPWDAETAEMLTRACEVAAFEDYTRAVPPRQRKGSRPAAVPAEAHATPDVTARLADVADRLQQALPRLDPAQWFAPLDERIRQIERQIASLASEPELRAGAERTPGVETQIRELADRFEQTRSELARLDAIEGRLAEIADRLREQEHRTGASGQDETVLARLTEQVAEHAAEKLMAALPATHVPNPGSDQIDTLAELLKAHAAERRQDARAAVAALQSIHRGIRQIADRDESAGVAESGIEDGYDPLADNDLLTKAYAEGARALGQIEPEATADPAGFGPASRGGYRLPPYAPDWRRQVLDAVLQGPAEGAVAGEGGVYRILPATHGTDTPRTPLHERRKRPARQRD